jgi:uncharacterized protein YwqG
MKEKLLELLRPLVIDCFKLSPVPGEFNEAYNVGTRFSGPVFSLPGETESLPVCVECGESQTFVVQFCQNPFNDTGELFQVFYCFKCVPIGLEKDIGQWLIRNYKKEEVTQLVETVSGSLDLEFCAIQATKIKMLPDFESLENKPDIIEACEAIDPDDPWEVYEEANMALGCETEPLSSVGGFPVWIQGETQKICPQCKNEMKFFAQIDSTAEADLMWGDGGCLYLFRCQNHQKEFAIEMQCF